MITVSPPEIIFSKSKEHCRIECKFESSRIGSRSIWVDYPADYNQFISLEATPWAILLLPFAIALREDLRMLAPVDQVLLNNLMAVQKIWASWYSWVTKVQILADQVTITKSHPPVTGGRALFFTGGIDSLSALLELRERNEGPELASSQLTLLAINGLDIPIDAKSEFEKIAELCKSIAKNVGERHLCVHTNLRQLEGYQSNWGALSHGPALAGIGHLFESIFGELYIASSYDIENLRPWGSHPMVDPLFSSSNSNILHHGAESNRVQKTFRILKDSMLASMIRVCWESGGAMNCSNCAKCLRTMATIDLASKQEVATSFDWSSYRVAQLRHHRLKNASDVVFLKEILELAQQIERQDIVEAIQQSIRQSRRRIRAYEIYRFLLRNVVSRLPNLRSKFYSP